MAKPVLSVPKSVKVVPSSGKSLGRLGSTSTAYGANGVKTVNKPAPRPGEAGYRTGNGSGLGLAAAIPGALARAKAQAPIGAPSGGGVKVDFANADGSPIGAPVVSYDPGVQARYDATRGGADLAYENATSGIAGERVGALARYGYSATGYDSKTGEGTGTSSDTWTVNTDNPFSVAAMAKRAYDQRTSGNQIQYANRGQLYSGALKNQQDATTFGYGQQDDAARKGLSAALSSLIAKKLGADNSRKAAYTDAAATRTEDQLKIAREQLNGR